jgi:ketosteroid isomerase-like protein
MSPSRPLLCLTLACLGFASFARAEPPREAPEHDELRALHKAIIAAYNAGDLDKLVSYLDDNVVITWQSSRVNKNPQEVKAYFEEMTKGPNRVVESSTINPEVDAPSLLYNDGKTAVAYGHSKDHYELTNGMKFDQDTRWSATLVKKDGAWKVVSIHISANEFDNPILDIAVRRTTWWAGGIGAAIGVIVGAAAFWLISRLRRKKA